MWELVITGEPILCVARHPSISSTIVLGLVSLISPMLYRGDYRPYFTYVIYMQNHVIAYTCHGIPYHFMSCCTVYVLRVAVAHNMSHIACCCCISLLMYSSHLISYFFFSIYDPDFKHYAQLHDSDPSTLPSVILGVTNPFFLKAFEKVR